MTTCPIFKPKPSLNLDAAMKYLFRLMLLKRHAYWVVVVIDLGPTQNLQIVVHIAYSSCLQQCPHRINKAS